MGSQLSKKETGKETETEKEKETETSKRLHEWIKTTNAQRIKTELSTHLHREAIRYNKTIIDSDYVTQNKRSIIKRNILMVEFSPVVYMLAAYVLDSDIEFLMDNLDISILTEGTKRFIRFKRFKPTNAFV
jgi:hypothetical protein